MGFKYKCSPSSACTVTCSDLNSEPYAISEIQNRAPFLLYGNITLGAARLFYCFSLVNHKNCL
jgi:hypothetical protein